MDSSVIVERVLGLLAQDVQEAVHAGDPLWPACPEHRDHALFVEPDLGPDRREELRLALEGGVNPYVRRTADGRLLVSVAEPARGTANVPSSDQ